MSDNWGKRLVRGVERSLVCVLIGVVSLVVLCFLLFVFIGAPAVSVVIDGDSCVLAFWPDWIALTVIALYLVYRVREWAHTVNGRK